MADLPEDLQYTEDHLWVRPGNGDRVRIGLTETAVARFGGIQGISLPEVGAELVRGDVLAEIETDEDSVDIEAPIGGELVEVNAVAADSPTEIAADPFGDGWLVAVEIEDPTELDDLLDADSYGALIEQR
ncbi:glycine cleavage system protein H [Acidipropionibacterium virtanenii]|uniref:Glycine cleavage system H protein n=1 Tax=Acidipropionibacterium virtanenii TaxID=2057246 RepID=A0A344UUG1_9ACTN|nr:glycine cleavage system protein H [Acidipropionibacterium virtanenii]AXE38909.1 Glycine cleavage system H protein [Acidipropionibacterium virtanenii]